jgi:hypothetical protein
VRRAAIAQDQTEERDGTDDVCAHLSDSDNENLFGYTEPEEPELAMETYHAMQEQERLEEDRAHEAAENETMGDEGLNPVSQSSEQCTVRYAVASEHARNQALSCRRYICRCAREVVAYTEARKNLGILACAR